MENKANNIRNEFLRKFTDLEKHGFYDFVEFGGKIIGFTIKKKLKREKENASMIAAGIYNEESPERTPLYINITYGKEKNERIAVRLWETCLKLPNLPSQKRF
ncbi:MAG: hypothetical protein PHH35_00865 [Candidatus Pacebacteria bacterium]|jgi:hypothetical protein|nr:hypothetical protein [Candidatus Paceibacterota bacterium]